MNLPEFNWIYLKYLKDLNLPEFTWIYLSLGWSGWICKTRNEIGHTGGTRNPQTDIHTHTHTQRISLMHWDPIGSNNKDKQDDQEYKSTRVQEYKSERVQEYKSTKVQDYKSTRVLEYKSTRIKA